MVNKKCSFSKSNIINLKEIDKNIKKTREEVRKIEDEVLQIHKKMSLLL